MKFDPRYQPELIVSKDVTREHLHDVELDVRGRRMLATDGHRAVIVPCEPADDDVSGSIACTALQAAKKAVRGRQAKVMGLQPTIKAQAILTVDASSDGKAPCMTFPRVDRKHIPFPPVDKVVPKMVDGADGTFTLRFNPRYLYELALAMGSPEAVAITVNTEQLLEPFVVRPHEAGNSAYGCIMPVAK